MIADVRRVVAKVAERFKGRFYGRTFRCPVCHLELAMVDADGNRLMVCPLCGVVLDVEEVYGHAVPVVLEVELHRPQPKLRVHPMATHIPIGLYPFAVLGVGLLVLASVLAPMLPGIEPVLARAPAVAGATLVLLIASVGLSIITFADGRGPGRAGGGAARCRDGGDGDAGPCRGDAGLRAVESILPPTSRRSEKLQTLGYSKSDATSIELSRIFCGARER